MSAPTLADAWLHTLDPVLVQLGPLAIRWYGLSYIAGFVAAWLLLRALAQRGWLRTPVYHVGDAMLWLVAGVVIGGRLGYCIFYRPSLFLDFSASLPFWGVLRITEGGMASHGGILGVILAGWRISRGFRTPGGGGEVVGRCPPLHVMDATALVAPFGLLFGRVANFINGELLGRIAAPFGVPAPSWSVRYPQEVAERWNELPIEQKHALASAARVESEAVAADDPAAIGAVFDWVTTAHEQSRQGSAPARQALHDLINARHPTQLYQAAVEGVLVGLAVWLVFRRARTPGVVGASFLMCYGVGRVLTEFVRLPDAHLEVQRVLGFSRGQWLSVAMVATGALLLAWVRRHGTNPLTPAPHAATRDPAAGA